MKISRKWQAAAAGLLALAMMGGTSVAAQAAPGDPLNPQSNGSDGALYVYDGDTGVMISDENHVFNKNDQIIAGTKTAFDGFVGDPTKFVGATAYYAFISSEPNLRLAPGGKNAWEAYGDAIPFSAAEGGAQYANVTAGSNGNYNGVGEGLWNDVGGVYYLGLGFTRGSGVDVLSVTYRTMTIGAGETYTLAPVDEEGAVTIPDPVEEDLDGITETAGLATTTLDSSVITIDLGDAYANRTVNVGAFSTYTDLGQVTLDANGVGTVDVAGKGVTPGAPHKLVVWDSSNGDILAWGAFTLTTSVPVFDSASVDLTATVSASNRFELIAPVATVNLGETRRNVMTAPVNLGGFKVIDDRNELRGWDVNASAIDFTSGSNTIDADALGYSVSRVGTDGGVATLGTDKVAGVAGFGAVASGAALSSTAEVGADFELALTFLSPVDAAVGTYGSTLTLDLVSK